MSDHYILKDRVAVKATIEEWSEFFEHQDRRVALTEIGKKTVSTVFLGLDHAWGDGPPMIFETMVHDGEHWDNERRCSTWEEAEYQHWEVCFPLIETEDWS